MSHRPRGGALVPALLVVSGIVVHADDEPRTDQPELFLPRIQESILVDGLLEDPGWRDALIVDRFFDNFPGNQAPPPVVTVGLLAYDSNYLYVGVRCADPEPDAIRAPWVERDRVTEQDLVQIDVDARDEGRWSMMFRVNPRGVQADGVFDETAGDDFSPDFHWDSAARIDAEGWTAEIRIPLATLRYRAADPQSWRIAFYRLYPRRFRYQIASMAIPRGSNCWLCHAPRYGITGLVGAKTATVAPFVTGNASDGPEANDRRTSRAVGVDLKWLPGPNMALDLAWNPDFSQVESDAPRVSVNNRFALLYPEKRPFFLEGSDLWNSPIQAINTRTITDPDWGVRLTGRPGRSSYTLLAATDAGGGALILPGPEGSDIITQGAGARVVLGRFRQTFGRSSIGALATLRDGADDASNSVAGVDLQWYPTASDRFVGQLLWSSTRDSESERHDGAAYLLGWEKSFSRLSWHLQLDELGRDFRADSGFVPQVGVRHTEIQTRYDVYRQGAIRSLSPHLRFAEAREPKGGGIVSQSFAAGVGIDGTTTVVVDWYGRDLERAPNGSIVEKSFWNLTARLLPSRRVPQVELAVRYGDELDLESSRLGTGADVTVAANVAASDRLQAELAGEWRWLDVPSEEGDTRLFAAAIGRVRLTYSFTARSFARLIGEWEALDHGGHGAVHRLGGSALFGYRLNWQSVLYVGYDNSPVPTASGRGGRQQTLFVKVAHAFHSHSGRSATAGRSRRAPSFPARCDTAAPFAGSESSSGCPCDHR